MAASQSTNSYGSAWAADLSWHSIGLLCVVARSLIWVGGERELPSGPKHHRLKLNSVAM